MTESDLRLCAFKLNPEILGSVWVYPWTDELWARWSAALDGFKALKKKLQDPYLRLPYGSLSLALTAISGGFVRISPKHWNDVFLVSSEPIPQMALQMALIAWERQITGTHSDLFKGVRTGPEERADLATYFDRGQTPGWVWEVAKWRAAQALAARDFSVDGAATALPLRLDSRADLLTWSNEGLLRGGKDLSAAAMHRISLEVKIIPGRPGVYLLASAGLSRVSSYRVRSARVDLGPDLPLLHVGVRSVKLEEGALGDRWEPRYEDWADKVLTAAAGRRLPTLTDEALRGVGELRGVHRTGRYPIGTGVGPYFYEFLGRHILNALPTLEPYTARWHGRMPKKLPPLGAVDDAGRREIGRALGSAPRLVVVYEDKRTRRHLEDALVDILGGNPGEVEALGDRGALVTPSGIEIAFEQVSGAGLTEAVGSDQLEAAVEAALKPHLASSPSMIALIETLGSEEIEAARQTRSKAARKGSRRSEDKDPKGRLRSHLASLGVVSQFVSPFVEERDALHMGARQVYPACGDQAGTTRENQKTYGKAHAVLKRARNAVWDLLCSAGVSLRPHLGAEHVPVGTWLIGIHSIQVPYGDRTVPGSNDGWVCTLSAMQVGGWRALGWDGSQWAPHNQAVAHHHHRFPQLAKGGLGRLMEEALSCLPGLSAPTRGEDPGLVVFIPAAPTRLWWRGVGDASDADLPAILEDLNAALVRIRTKGDEVPGVVGRGDWPSADPVRLSYPFDHLFWPFEVSDPPRAYWISSTHPRSSNQTIRGNTRYKVVGTPHMGKAWHTSGVREILVQRRGPYDPEKLVLLTVQQVRSHPAYAGLSLLRPLPLHLAHKVLKDHPRFHYEDEEEAGSEE